MPSTFRADIGSLLENYALLLQVGLIKATRQSYQPVVRSFEHFCKLRCENAWPVSESLLSQQITLRAYGSSDHLISQIKLSIIISYLSALCSYYMDYRISTIVFDSLYLLRLVQGARSLFPGQKRERLPITWDILLKITPTLNT